MASTNNLTCYNTLILLPDLQRAQDLGRPDPEARTWPQAPETTLLHPQGEASQTADTPTAPQDGGAPAQVAAGGVGPVKPARPAAGDACSAAAWNTGWQRPEKLDRRRVTTQPTVPTSPRGVTTFSEQPESRSNPRGLSHETRASARWAATQPRGGARLTPAAVRRGEVCGARRDARAEAPVRVHLCKTSGTRRPAVLGASG